MSTRSAVTTPRASSEDVRRRMVATKRRDTPGELRIRRILHGRGLRYSVDVPPLRTSKRRADIVFRPARVAVFVDGCFWHCCPLHRTQPKKNAAWWRAKLAANVRRDSDTNRELRSAGWRVVRVWAHEDPEQAAAKVQLAVAGRRPMRTRHMARGLEPT
jgi:DNA mismatch endonuclease (patch repair protein)